MPSNKVCAYVCVLHDENTILYIKGVGTGKKGQGAWLPHYFKKHFLAPTFGTN